MAQSTDLPQATSVSWRDSGNESSRTRILRPRNGLVPIDFHELYHYRELLWFLTWRNVLIRYKQTVLGVLWAIIQPVVTMVVLTVIFGRVANLPDGGVPYSMLTLAAVLPWQFFSSAVQQGSVSVVGAQNMIHKIYFPRLYLPTSACLAAAVDFLISLIILFVMMLWFGLPFRPHLLLLPMFSLLAFTLVFGASLWFSALNVTFRDVGHLLPFVVRIGMYVSPVGFMSSLIPDRWRFWYSLNPLVGVIDGFRWSILGDNFAPYWPGFWASVLVALILSISGVYYFRYTEKTFADVI